MATKRTALCAALGLLCGAAGCSSPRGILYTRTTEPFFLPQRPRAATGGKSCRIDITQLKEPISRANLSVVWTSQAVAAAAARAGVSELRYADIETLSLLNGIYARRRLVFYGD